MGNVADCSRLSDSVKVWMSHREAYTGMVREITGVDVSILDYFEVRSAVGINMVKNSHKVNI